MDYKDTLSIYSDIVLNLTNYLHQSKQSCKVILNNSQNKCPIFISEDQQENTLGKVIGLPLLKVGNTANKYENVACMPRQKKA